MMKNDDDVDSILTRCI